MARKGKRIARLGKGRSPDGRASTDGGGTPEVLDGVAAGGAEALDHDRGALHLVRGGGPDALLEAVEMDPGNLGDLAATQAPDVEVGAHVQVVAGRGLRPVLGLYDPDLLQHAERLVDGAEGHARVLLLDEQVDVLGRGVTAALAQGLEDGLALRGQRVARPAKPLAYVRLQRGAHVPLVPSDDQ